MASQRKIYAQLLARYGREIELAFREAVARAATAVDLAALTRAIDANDMTTAARLVQLDANRLFPVTEAVRGTYVAGGASVLETLPRIRQGAFSFSGRNVRAESWISNHVDNLIRDITSQTMPMVQSVIENGLAQGIGSRRMALDITGRMNKVTGRREGGFMELTAKQGEYVRNARGQLETLDSGYFSRKLRDRRYDAQVRKAIESGKPLPKAVQDKIINRYHDRMLAHRGKVLATDQAHTALAEGTHEGFRQLKETPGVQEVTKRWQWNFSGDPREDHQAMASAPARPLDMPFVFGDGTSMQKPHEDGAPAHHKLGCGCTVFYRPVFADDAPRAPRPPTSSTKEEPSARTPETVKKAPKRAFEIEDYNVVGKEGEFTYAENRIPAYTKHNTSGVMEGYRHDQNVASKFREMAVENDIVFGEQEIPLSKLTSYQSTVRLENLQSILENFDMDKFVGDDPATVFIMPDGQFVLRDGNHRINAALANRVSSAKFQTIQFRPITGKMPGYDNR